MTDTREVPQTSTLIEAAGGVVWRPALGGHGAEVLLVHRPKYDDWSVPKGKLEPGEHPVLGALREVREETGLLTRPGTPLGEIRYLKEGRPKRVRYWSLEVVGGAFLPSDEVDQIMWIPPREATRHLAPGRDEPVLERFCEVPRPTRPLVVVRHASAGSRAAWTGDDRERPLDELGDRQAEALAAVLAAYRVDVLRSADVLRCLETLGPYAALRHLPVESEPLFSESGYAENPDAAVGRLLEVVDHDGTAAVCSQGDVIDELLGELSARLGQPVLPPAVHVRKGGFAVVHLTVGVSERLAALEVHQPVA